MHYSGSLYKINSKWLLSRKLGQVDYEFLNKYNYNLHYTKILDNKSSGLLIIVNKNYNSYIYPLPAQSNNILCTKYLKTTAKKINVYS